MSMNTTNPYTVGVHCKNCGEQMEGDGYNTVLHCPNAEEDTWWYHEPDANPVECEGGKWK